MYNKGELGISEINKLLADERAGKKWPEYANKLRLAKAVKARDEFVIFEGDLKFKIRYDSKFEAVYVSPAWPAFVPCGYFSYKELRLLLEDA